MKIKNIILPLVAALMLSSCNYLDFDETSGLNTKENIYRYFNQTKQMLTNVYSYMPQSLDIMDGTMRDCAIDDAEYGATGAHIQDFNNGNWSALKARDSQWDLYKGIRAANEFLVEVANVDFSRYEYDVAYQNWLKQLAYFPYEARILRAYYFFDLARRYGDIAMPVTMLTTDEANSIGKTPFQEVIGFIVSECDEAIGKLPETYVGQPNEETGRITKGFAMALKSKALLYAASQLHNPAMNQDRWKSSAKAALELINTGLYRLDPEEKANNITSPENVLLRMNGDDNIFELANFPLRFTAGKRTGNTGVFPSQNLVDAYETLNGYPVVLDDNGWECADPAFDPQQPYINRDPRFYRAVLANGMAFKGSVIEQFKGGADEAPVSSGGTPTGYFLRKYIQESTNFEPDKEVSNKHHWVIYRYAETLLTYAESMVQAFGDPDYTDNVYTKSARSALNDVRINASMPTVTATTKDAFIEALQNEWRVEFAFEDHRFWDVRRWKIGNKSQEELCGVSIEKLGTGELTFRKTVYENRVWNERMYLYPIPQNELFKNPNLNPQNAGW